jgi:hypothetical protein
MDIVALRLHNQRLAGNPLNTVKQVVAHLGAVQAQEYPAGKGALAMRLRNVTNVQIDKLFNDGEILRTHVMRPTWHFVTPEDILWMLELTAPRIKQAMAYYNRKLELDGTFFQKSNQIIGEALAGGSFLTRQELAHTLSEHGIDASGQRLGHIMMQAELDGVICSGPLKGKQFSYALLSERAPNAKRMDRQESLVLLSERYFMSHGPATIQDFAWWSGLTNADAKLGVQLSKRLTSLIIDTKEYWFGHTSPITISIPKLMLLSVYDEYVIAYNDYTPVFPPQAHNLTKLFGNAWLNYVVVKEGRVIGSFRRQAKPHDMRLEFRLVVPTSKADKRLIESTAKQYASFFDLPAKVNYSD